MRRLSTYIIALTAAMIAAVSCIYDFDPNIGGSGGQFVIEGDILIGDITTVTIERTEPLKPDSLYNYHSPVSLFQANVVADDGTVVCGEQKTANDYCNRDHIEIDTRFLDSSRKYRMEITNKFLPDNGPLYVTPWLEPLHTQSMDSLRWAIDDERRNLEIQVSASGEGDTGYLRWTGREVWEYTAPLYARSYFYLPTGDILDYDDGNNSFYCWNRGNVSDVMVADVSEVSDSRIVDYRLYSYSKENIKISCLYRVDIIQECISGEAYKYWKTLSRNTDDIGGLFSSQPSEFRGNIVNERDSSEVVLGFISASVVSKKRLYVDFQDTRFSSYRIEVPEATIVKRSEWLRFYNAEYRPYMIYAEELPNGDVILDPDIFEWYPRRCIDCTVAGGYKTRPDDWPNDHK